MQYRASCDKTHKPSGAKAKLETTQSLQNPLIKEYSLNHIRDPTII